jgi:hypothetical protein
MFGDIESLNPQGENVWYLIWLAIFQTREKVCVFVFVLFVQFKEWTQVRLVYSLYSNRIVIQSWRNH